MSDLPSPQENAHARTKVLRLQAENARLKAKVERLRKAGDGLYGNGTKQNNGKNRRI